MVNCETKPELALFNHYGQFSTIHVHVTLLDPYALEY